MPRDGGGPEKRRKSPKDVEERRRKRPTKAAPPPEPDDELPVRPEPKKKRRRNVEYSTTGKKRRGGVKGWQKGVMIAAGVVGVLALAVYVPPRFAKETSTESYEKMENDVTAIKTYVTYAKDHMEDDFDGDGLTNAQEEKYGSDPWKMDTDGDGVSDYAEVTITNTNPNERSSVMVTQVQDDDAKNGNSLRTPMRQNEVIMWPNDYSSKAYGAVVLLDENRYRFCYFDGWVKFPNKVKAYAVRNGVHYELEHDDEADAWRITDASEIVTYEEGLTFTNELTLPFLGKKYLADGGFGSFLSDVLPDSGGFLTCRRIATMDADPDVAKDVTATPRNPHVDRTDVSRFGRNQNTIKDLKWVKATIDGGDCVAFSMYSGTVGETIGIIYGYDKDGNLLVCDESLKPTGKLKITLLARRMMDKDGEIGFVNWFEWSGFGYSSSAYGDRIAFVGSTAADDKAAEKETELEEIGTTKNQTAEGTDDGAEIEEQAPATEIQVPQTETQTQAPQTETAPPQTETALPQTETQAPETEPPTEEKKPFVATF